MSWSTPNSCKRFYFYKKGNKLKDCLHGGSRRGASCHAQMSACWLRLSQSESSAQALNDGDTAMRAGAALQGRLGLHLPGARIKGEDAVGAFPVFVPPTKDVDLPITHCKATALLRGQTDEQLTGMHSGNFCNVSEPCLTD